MRTVNEHPTDVNASPVETLLGVLAAYLDDDAARLKRLWPVEPQRLDEMLSIGLANRLETWLVSAAARSGAVLPNMHRERLTRAQREIIDRNAIGLMTAQKVSEALAAEGVDACFFKGPMAQHLLHGTYFQRRSTDIDVLVRPRDLTKSQKALGKLGYEIMPECRSLWWRAFLREQHFYNLQPRLCVVDLHTSVQQPGGPQPRRLDRFLETETCFVGSTRVAIPKLEYSLLISAISLYKAIQHREPAGVHLMDLAVALRRFPADLWEHVDRAASEQGIERLLNFSVETARSLAGFDADFRAVALPGRRSLAHAVLGSPMTRSERVSRTRVHWTVSETLPRFIGQAAWGQMSEAVRIFFERSGRARRRSLPADARPTVQAKA